MQEREGRQGKSQTVRGSGIREQGRQRVRFWT